MTSHSFKSSHGQCACRWCGKYRHYHIAECSVSQSMRSALAAFAAAEGRTWKRKLNDLWQTANVPNAELQQVRNIIGPSGLLRIPGWLIQREIDRAEES